MSEEQNQKMSSRGRVLRNPGMGNKQHNAIQKMREMKTTTIKRTDQYEVSEFHKVLFYFFKFRLFFCAEF